MPSAWSRTYTLGGGWGEHGLVVISVIEADAKLAEKDREIARLRSELQAAGRLTHAEHERSTP